MPSPTHPSKPATIPAPTPSPALGRLLDEGRRYLPEDGHGFSNHLPMALAALDGLGADASRLQTFHDRASRRLIDASPATGAEPLPDWPAARGDYAALGALRATFADALARRGRDAVLREALPQLIDSAGAAAFHGLIRSAHAVESSHDGELAAALGYWAARWFALEPPDERGARIDGIPRWLDAVDARLREADAGWSGASALISTGMRGATQTHAYRELAGQLHTAGLAPADLLHELALAAAARYAATDNFTVLHMATGARAARVLAPWLPADAAALRPLWWAVAAASLASGAATAPRPPSTAIADAALDWPTVIERACVSDDAHVIKLVHAMATQQRAAPHPAWLRAARVAVA